MKIKKLVAFTLAEVLITLSIIGVVAALTVPNLSRNIKKLEYSSKLRKFYSTLTNAAKRAETEESLTRAEWDYTLNSKDFFDRYFANFFVIKKVNFEDDWKFAHNYKDMHRVYLADGTTLAIGQNKSPGDNPGYIFRFDVNGDKGPNKTCIDIFNFSVRQKDADFFVLYYHTTTRNEVLQAVTSNTESNACSKLLWMDNWTFKDDYPYLKQIR